MKLVFKGLVLASSLIAHATVYATGCASISFQHSTEQNKILLVELLSSNNIVPERFDNRLYSLDFVSENKNFIFEEGEHNLLLSAWYKRDYREWIKKAKLIGWGNIPAISYLYKGVPIQNNMRLVANHHYTLAAKSVGTDKFTFSIVDVKSKQCKPNAEVLLKAVKVDVNQNATLPNQLEAKLRILMNNLAGSETAVRYGGLVGTEATLDFGVIGNWSKEQKNFKVLAIKPFSKASRLGLLSGDLLTGLNNKSFKKQNKPSNQFTNIFNEMELGEKYTLRVTRNNKELTFSGAIDIEVTPGARYRILPDNKLIIKKANLSPSLAAEYKNVVNEITQHLKKQGMVGLDKFSVQRAKKLITSFGIVGKVIGLESQNSFKVSSVLVNTYADKAGIKAGDEIISYNGADDINGLLNGRAFKESLGESIVLTVNRNGMEKRLSVQLMANYDVAFDLVINLTDKKDLIATLTNDKNKSPVLVRNIKRKLKRDSIYFNDIFNFSQNRNKSTSMSIANTTGGHRPAKSLPKSTSKNK